MSDNENELMSEVWHLGKYSSAIAYKILSFFIFKDEISAEIRIGKYGTCWSNVFWVLLAVSLNFAFAVSVDSLSFAQLFENKFRLAFARKK